MEVTRRGANLRTRTELFLDLPEFVMQKCDLRDVNDRKHRHSPVDASLLLQTAVPAGKFRGGGVKERITFEARVAEDYHVDLYAQARKVDVDAVTTVVFADFD